MTKSKEILIFSGSSHEELAKDIASRLGITLSKLRVGHFTDNEIDVEIIDDVRGKDVFVVQTIAGKPNEYLMELLIIVDALKRASAAKITAVIPYFGYSRQDRLDKPQVPITARLVANLLEVAGVNKIITSDLHAAQIEGFFNIPVENLHCKSILIEEVKKLIPENLIVVSPDVGSIKLVRDIAKELNSEMAIINKQRLTAANVKTLQLIGDVKGKIVLLADDMCSTGDTIASAAKACHEKGAETVLACVTHLVGDVYERLRQSPIEALIMTDTVPFNGISDKPNGFFHSVSTANLFAQAIKR